MRRIFWDAMYFIYLLENNERYSGETVRIFEQSLQRQDEVLTSYLALGEVSAMPERLGTAVEAQKTVAALEALPFRVIAFDGKCVRPFALLRRERKVKTADAINLACAASAQVDLFLTEDKELHGLQVPGIKFVAGLDSGLL